MDPPNHGPPQTGAQRYPGIGERPFNQREVWARDAPHGDAHAAVGTDNTNTTRGYQRDASLSAGRTSVPSPHDHRPSTAPAVGRPGLHLTGGGSLAAPSPATGWTYNPHYIPSPLSSYVTPPSGSGQHGGMPPDEEQASGSHRASHDPGSCLPSSTDHAARVPIAVPTEAYLRTAAGDTAGYPYTGDDIPAGHSRNTMPSPVHSQLLRSRSARRHTFPRHLHDSVPPTLIVTPPPPSANSNFAPAVLRNEPTATTHSASPPRQHADPVGVIVPPRPLRLPRAPRPADHSTTDSAFQPDYTRIPESAVIRPSLALQTTSSLPKPDSLDHSRGVESSAPSDPSPIDAGVITIPPPPAEAFMILRIRNEPRGGWPAVGVEEGSTWTPQLHIVQEPSGAAAFGDAELASAVSRLDPPFIVRVSFLDGLAQVSNHAPLVEKRLVYMTLQISLVDAERGAATPSTEAHPLELVRLPETTYDGSAGRMAADTLGPALMGRTFGVARRAVLAGTDGWYFAFEDLRVRPTGTFRLQARLIDVLGPGITGTSTGITPVSATVLTSPFTVHRAADFSGISAPARTALTAEAAAQGLFGPRRRASGSGSAAESGSSGSGSGGGAGSGGAHTDGETGSSSDDSSS